MCVAKDEREMGTSVAMQGSEGESRGQGEELR